MGSCHGQVLIETETHSFLCLSTLELKSLPNAVDLCSKIIAMELGRSQLYLYFSNTENKKLVALSQNFDLIPEIGRHCGDYSVHATSSLIIN